MPVLPAGDIDSVDITGKPSTPPSPPPPIASLPPELLDLILFHVPAKQRTRAALALASVLGHEPARQALYAHVVVRRGAQLMPIWKKFKDIETAKVVRTFSLETWRGDVDILNNALRCLPALRTVMLNIGTNFVPEHLQEMFERPRLDIERMEMRFRPYVEQASYYQFLKGSYFDTAIRALYKNWPANPNFTKLSIVQDLPPRSTAPPTRIHSAVSLLADDLAGLNLQSRMASRLGSAAVSAVGSTAASTAQSSVASVASSDNESESDTPPTSIDEADGPPHEPKGYTGHGPIPYLSDRLADAKPKNFAQPIVFFNMEVLSIFGASPVAQHLTHLRLRVPSRDVAHILVLQPTRKPLFPALRYLDISTSNVRMDAVLATLLRSYPLLEHLVIDRVNLFGFAAREHGIGLCRELGQLCVSAGLARGKERERQISAWDVSQRTRQAERLAEQRRAQVDSDSDADDEARAAREEERQAQLMRDEMQRQIALARSRRGHRSAAHSTISLRDRRRGTTSSSVLPADLPVSDRAYFVLPPLPSLKTISIGGEAPLLKAWQPNHWEDEFHAGWRTGLAALHGWATSIADKYERAQKKAAEWNSTANKKKGKSKVTVKPPPLDVRLYRFASGVTEFDPDDPLVGLEELHPEGREYLATYKEAIADAELYTHSQGYRPPCVLCTTPDCEGPRRRGADPGDRVDGRGGMDRPHKAGCGHEIGREIWGWESVQ